MLDNEFVRVFHVEVAPHASTLMHRHRHDYIYVALGDAHVENDVEGKAPADVKLGDGDTRFVPGNFAHIARNLSDRPFRNVTIELTQDESLRNEPPRWQEEADETFLGGRKRVLFVKDGVRVCEIDLDPGLVAPPHYDGSKLLVAVTDLDLRSVDGAGSMAEKLKSGDIKWVPAGDTQTLKNVGKSQARFVTVEF